MKTNFLMTPAGQAVVLAAVIGGALYYGEKKARKVANAVNPVSDENIFYQGVNGIGGAVTGDSDFNLGYWIYDTIHGKPEP